ncbi:MAG: hypothetical protein M3478_02180, partial [Planctomycetota bacterium]|nr:hypothetical protein [Planctomycetota bacterium]
MRHALERLESRRLFAAGDLDPTFGTGGVVDLPAGTGGREGGSQQAIAVMPDDRLLVIGGPAAGDTLSVLRLTAAGAPDPTFGTAGRVSFTLDDDATNDEFTEAVYA